MAVNVVGIWERGWTTPMQEMDLWEMVTRDFGVDELRMSPVSGIFNKHVVEKESYEEVLADARAAGSKLVFISETGTTNLADYTHPADATYVLGKIGFDANTAYLKEGDDSVVIPTGANLGLLWPHQCLAIVLYDRLMKAS